MESLEVEFLLDNVSNVFSRIPRYELEQSLILFVNVRHPVSRLNFLLESLKPGQHCGKYSLYRDDGRGTWDSGRGWRGDSPRSAARCAPAPAATPARPPPPARAAAGTGQPS